MEAPLCCEVQCSSFVRLCTCLFAKYEKLLISCQHRKNLVESSTALFACVAVPKKEHTRVFLTFTAWLVFLYFFWKIGDPFPILSPKHGEYCLRIGSQSGQEGGMTMLGPNPTFENFDNGKASSTMIYFPIV